MILKKEKSQVGYSRGKLDAHCGLCVHFRPETKRCALVKGPISADMWCRLFKREAAK